MKTVGLCMIVKDEAPLILRCLKSACPLIDHVLICDTGSTDGTQQIIRDWLSDAGLPGMVIEEPWRDFATNRSSALRHLRDVDAIDYALMIDADDTVALDPDFDVVAFKASLDAGLYDVDIVLGPYHWPRAQLFSNRKEFRYRGVVHEFVDGPPGETTGHVRGFHIAAGVEGGRTRNPNKYRDDAKTLELALATETDEYVRCRYAFYIAQSWRDAGEPQEALSWYRLRSKMAGGAYQEIVLSWYNMGHLKEWLSRPASDVVGTYLRAYNADPSRAEALRAVINYCHRSGLAHLGYLIGKQAIGMAEPEGKHFAESWVYHYGLLDDFAVAAYWSGHYRECVSATARLLDEQRIPADAVLRIRTNRDLAAQKLAEQY